MKGRKPKPTSIVEIEGNPGKRLHKRGAEPKFAQIRGSIEPPEHLDAIAAAEWRRLAPDMAAIGLLTEADKVALEAYCTHYSLWRYALHVLQTEGMVHTTPNGHKQVSPYDTMIRQHAALMYKFGGEFGLTPASRARIAVPEKGDDEKEKAMFG